jgi:hypothetical protein
MSVVCFTSFAFGYLSRARVLAETLRAAHPDWALWAVLVDRPPPGFANRAAFAGFDRVLGVEDLGIPRVLPWLFRHDLIEACTAVKGAMLRHLLGLGAETVVYLDPDIAVFHKLASLAERLENASILLTPHQTEADSEAPAILDNERASLRYGAYNLGFLAVRNDATGRAFAEWWAARLHAACFDAPEAGLFTDQKYFDAVPGLFGRVAIVRDPGWNVASWNLSQRRLRFEPDGGISVSGSPLAFYHFSKYGGAGDVMTERYAGDAHEPHELWRWYGRRLAALAEPGIPDGWWHFAMFSDGTPIPRAARLLARERPDVMERFDDPFDASFRRWLERDQSAAAEGVSSNTVPNPSDPLGGPPTAVVP